MGGEVVGINTETFDGNKTAIKEAKTLLKSQGAKYRNLSIDSSSDAGNNYDTLMKQIQSVIDAESTKK